MRHYRTLALAGTTALAVLGTGGAAVADDARANLVSVKAGNITVNSQNCKYTPVTVAWSVEPGIEVWSAYADVYHGTSIIDSHDLTTSSNYFYCPYSNGVGSFRFGPGTQVAASDEYYTNDYLFTDNTTGSFTARYASRATLSAARSGTRVTVTARASRYLLSANAYTAWNPPRTRLQVLSGGQWVTVKDLVMTRGAVTYSFTSASSRSYRILTSSSSSVWGASSAAVAR